jgi:hypothetical protein
MTPIFQGLFGLSEGGNERADRSSKASAGYVQGQGEKEIEPSTGEKSKEEEARGGRGREGTKEPIRVQERRARRWTEEAEMRQTKEREQSYC